MSRIDEIRRWSRIQADMERSAAKNGISPGESKNEKRLRKDIDYLLSQLKDGGAEGPPSDVDKLLFRLAAKDCEHLAAGMNDCTEELPFADWCVVCQSRGLLQKYSPATTPTGTSARCGECGHSDGVGADGFCQHFEIKSRNGGSRCLHKCIFPASTEVAGEQWTPAKPPIRRIKVDAAPATPVAQPEAKTQMKQLPTWSDCEAACDDLTATPLQTFIYNYEPGDNDSEWRNRLMKVLTTARANAIGECLEVLRSEMAEAHEIGKQFAPLMPKASDEGRLKWLARKGALSDALAALEQLKGEGSGED